MRLGLLYHTIPARNKSEEIYDTLLRKHSHIQFDGYKIEDRDYIKSFFDSIDISIKLYNQALLLRLRKIFNRFNKRKYQFNHKILSYLFKRALCKSYISYTDGSELDMFVRKYLEIPSCKSLLYCDPFLDMENYGFIDGVNYIKRDPLHTQEQILSLLKDKAKLKEVSFNGFNLMKQNFTLSSTKPILSSTLLSISNGSFTSLDWKEGKLLLEINDEK